MKTQFAILASRLRNALLLTICLTGLNLWQAAAVGSWMPLANPAPARASRLLLLSDGTVMVQHTDAPAALTTTFFRLTPDTQGSYVNGTWSQLAAMHQSRVFHQSFVLPDGRVVMAGGEYGTGTNDVEVYDPVLNTWTSPLVSSATTIRDGCSELLPDGRLLVFPNTLYLSPPFTNMIYDPAANAWLDAPPALASQDEATWIKLPDDSILTIDRNASTTERYIPALNRWIPDAPVPPASQVWSNVEIGAALLLPNGKAFFLGASGKTALYTPSGTTNVGSWAPGATMPTGMVTRDAPAAMMVNGKILCALHSPVGDSNNTGPIYFYEYDYLANTFTQVNSPTGGLADYNAGANRAGMLCLPDGKILYSDTTTQLHVYTPDGSPLSAGKPVIHAITPNGDGSYQLTGTGLNGLSAGAAYGDDAQMNSNYPLIRFASGGTVTYGRTFDWSRTGVMTGNREVATQFTVPAGLTGAYSLVVVANGISSDPVLFPAPVWVDFNYAGGFQFGTYPFPFKTLAQGVSAVPASGTIKIKTAGSTPETLTISKPMTIVAVGGPATIGKP